MSKISSANCAINSLSHSGNNSISINRCTATNNVNNHGNSSVANGVLRRVDGLPNRAAAVSNFPASSITQASLMRKLTILLVIVVTFDVIHIYKLFNNTENGNDIDDNSSTVTAGSSSSAAGPEAGIHNLHLSRRMDGLADAVLAKWHSAYDSDRSGSVRGTGSDISTGDINRKASAFVKSNNIEHQHKRQQNLQQQGGSDYHLHKQQKHYQQQQQQKTHDQQQQQKDDEDEPHVEEHKMQQQKTKTEDHFGISIPRFNQMSNEEKIEELQLEVDLWKARFELAMRKLEREQNELSGPAQREQLDSPLDPDAIHKEGLTHLMYEGFDVEKVRITGQDIIQPYALTNSHEVDDGNEPYDPNKVTDPFKQSEEGYGVDPHILKILRSASVEIDEELASLLPTWEDITSMYGSKPIVFGLETCEPYREMVKPEDRMIGPSGMFNTGTNLLYQLMSTNCKIKEAIMRPRREPKHNGMRWQAPWGKHNPPSTHRFKNVAKAWGKGIKQDDFMPVVLIKDPYSWMGSQCRHKYTTFWGHDENHCPNLIRWKVTNEDLPTEVLVKYALEMKRYKSLLDMWNSWYNEWESVTFPALHTRFEDLLFHGEEVIKIACDCVGGVFTDHFEYVEDSAKPNLFGIHKGSNGLVQAMLQYGDPGKRLTGFTERDMVYASKAMDMDLMQKYGYIAPSLSDIPMMEPQSNA